MRRPSLLLLGVLLLALPGAARAADLAVTVADLRDDRGMVRVALYSEPKTFRKEELSLAVRQTTAHPDKVTVRFEGLAPGRYAVIAYHDEDGDGAMDRFMGMIPTEGFALSNNPEVTGPPAFEEAAFDLSEMGGEVTVNLRY